MRIDSEHRLAEARWAPTSHCEPRPVGCCPELVVVHCVSLPEGHYGTGYAEALFTGSLDTSVDDSFADLQGLRVAPHLFIDRDGAVVQFVGFDQQAWHAGVSQWRGREGIGCNAYSIGIELEGCVADDYTAIQYESLSTVLVTLLHHYPELSVERIVGHQEIAPGRKYDPGPHFEWAILLRKLLANT